jgi:hypothetical protein
MKHQTLVMGSVIAVGVIAIVICVGMVNGYSAFKPFISVDPVSDKNVGDVVTITGKTSFPVGTELLIETDPASYKDQTGTGSGVFSGASGTVTVTKGSGIVNTWSWPLDTSTFQPMDYLVSVSSVKGDISKGNFAKGDTSASTTFTLKATSVTASTSPYIQVNPIAEKTTGDLLIVSGTTNLPAGTSLMISTGNFAGNTVVAAGAGGANRFSLPVDTSSLKPGSQKITVSEITSDPADGSYTVGSVSVTSTFTLNGIFLGSDTPILVTPATSDFITVNPIGDHSVGDQFLITGTTSLPVGTSLFWQVMPDTGTSPTSVNKTAVAVGGSNIVTKGSGTTNRVSFAADMNRMPAGKWVALVGVMKNGEPEVENPIATA